MGRSKGLGEYFLDTLWSDMLSLRLSGGIHAVHNGCHRLLSRRFPYAVYLRGRHTQGMPGGSSDVVG
jgi:hypothetical protein